MKKSIILVVLILIVIAILPMVGNSLIKKSIDGKILELKNVGIEIKADTTNSSYLTTSRHFEFLLKDSRNFFKYLDIQSTKMVDDMFDGVIIGVDIKYNNLPFSKSINIEIYPLKMSGTMQKSLQKEGIRVYRYLETFFKLKRALLHINYNLLNNQFKGYLKDIDEKLSLQNAKVIKFKILKLSFDEKIKDNKSETLNFFTKEFSFSFEQNIRKVNLVFENLKGYSKYKSKNIYKNSLSIKKMTLVSNATAKDLDFEMQNFNFDAGVDGLDKKELKNLGTLMVRQSFTPIMSKGFVLDIYDFSCKNIVLNKKENLKGFSLKSKVVIKKDTKPLLQNFDISVDIKLSKEIYSKLQDTIPFSIFMKQYVKIDKNDVIFDIILKNSKLSINGKSFNR